MNHGYIITLRTTGERTEKVSLYEIRQQAGDAQIVIVNEQPFKFALETCYELALKSEKKWLVTVDADMILFPGILKYFMAEAEKMPENYLQIQGKILDKISGTIRKAGPRIYRVELLDEALEISRSIEDHIRPESRVISLMGEKGYPSRYISPLLCIHDFEQYYEDLYRKAFVHARKHIEFLPDMIRQATSLQKDDSDYHIILKGIFDGLISEKPVAIDKNLFKKESKEAIAELGLVEKDELHHPVDVNAISDAYSFNDNSLTFDDIKIFDEPFKSTILSNREIMSTIKKKGYLRGLMYGLGLLLIRAGNRIKKKFL